MRNNNPTNNSTHLIWGAALVIVGIAVFFRIPQVMPKLAEIGQSATTIGFVRVCFYLVGIILIGGGAKKIILFVRAKKSVIDEDASETNED